MFGGPVRQLQHLQIQGLLPGPCNDWVGKSGQDWNPARGSLLEGPSLWTTRVPVWSHRCFLNLSPELEVVTRMDCIYLQHFNFIVCVCVDISTPCVGTMGATMCVSALESSPTMWVPGIEPSYQPKWQVPLLLSHLNSLFICHYSFFIVRASHMTGKYSATKLHSLLQN